MQLDIESKEAQIKKYNTLVEQSEEALNKMIASSQKLNETLSSALNNKIWAFMYCLWNVSLTLEG